MSPGAVVAVERRRLRVTGAVQGVGFRPYVFRLAGTLGLTGFVLNDTHGVLIEIEGEVLQVDEFRDRLAAEAPPLAVVESVQAEAVPIRGGRGFEIRSSPLGGRPDAAVSADAATCADCLHELADPADRRYRYPFINCTNCGPRFTIVRGIPYDRPLTTMAGFVMCAACRAEYEDPGNRRFHAQPNACPACGPALSLIGGASEGADALAAAAADLARGRIVAIKGIGGYHLACRADDEAVVGTLRARKRREDKPFALMVADVAAAERLVALSPRARVELGAPARPIVLAERRRAAAVAPSVAPAAAELGVMLPYTPAHHLLLGDLRRRGVDAIVLTSGNVSDEPIAFDDDDALGRLAGIADAFLTHNRPIETRTDDSVIRTVRIGSPPRERPLMVRRARGYVPATSWLPGGTPVELLAVGAELKHTFCLASGERAWVSHHIGDLQNAETLASLQTGVEHFRQLFALTPEVIVHDLHPAYLSTEYALAQEDLRAIAVQHHHAHLAGCLAEHGHVGEAAGAIFDGTGYGTDGTVWGGEFLVGGEAGFARRGMLWPVRMPGGEAAIREPWRMACAWLVEALGEDPPLPVALVGSVAPKLWRQVAELAAGGYRSPLTSSVGRLFDAVAALLGVRARVNYEGQAAVELEALCAGISDPVPYTIEVVPDEPFVLDPRELLRAVVRDVERGADRRRIAAGFHAALAQATVRGGELAASRANVGSVVLSGGVFLNRRLLERAAAGLERAGLRVLVPERLPPGDGGICFGQAAVAAARLRAEA